MQIFEYIVCIFKANVCNSNFASGWSLELDILRWGSVAKYISFWGSFTWKGLRTTDIVVSQEQTELQLSEKDLFFDDGWPDCWHMETGFFKIVLRIQKTLRPALHCSQIQPKSDLVLKSDLLARLFTLHLQVTQIWSVRSDSVSPKLPWRHVCFGYHGNDVGAWPVWCDLHVTCI